jgi:hypothetical protein
VFIDSRSIQGLDTSCVEHIPLPPFKLRDPKQVTIPAKTLAELCWNLRAAASDKCYPHHRRKHPDASGLCLAKIKCVCEINNLQRRLVTCYTDEIDLSRSFGEAQLLTKSGALFSCCTHLRSPSTKIPSKSKRFAVYVPHVETHRRPRAIAA